MSEQTVFCLIVHIALCHFKQQSVTVQARYKVRQLWCFLAAQLPGGFVATRKVRLHAAIGTVGD